MTNVLFTAWILISTRWEERDLVAQFGEAYVRYQADVPMLFPLTLQRVKNLFGRPKGAIPSSNC